MKSIIFNSDTVSNLFIQFIYLFVDKRILTILSQFLTFYSVF